MSKHYISLFLIAFVIFFTIGCKKYTPHPVGYYRIDIPKNEYRKFDTLDYPYKFDLSKYAQIIAISSTKDDKYWINIYYPKFHGKIYCSYKVINHNFKKISEDTREFVYKHTEKADAITEQPFVNKENNTYGILYKLEGNTASSVQFVVTDSVSYLFRGALYFNSPPNKDSIAPVVKFINKDVMRLMETFQHKKK
jgi:gliding motility-associated lipoprotein GldD